MTITPLLAVMRGSVTAAQADPGDLGPRWPIEQITDKEAGLNNQVKINPGVNTEAIHHIEDIFCGNIP
jgi:hypothetical protein